MDTLRQRIHGASAGLLLLAAAACSSGGLGNVLGGVLNAPGNQMTGTVQGVDTRSETVFIRENDGTTVAIRYDDRTRVVYENREYSVSSLEAGDKVTARVQENGNDNYYTDYIQVTASASGGTGAGAVYNLSGTVRQVDTYNGWFTMDSQQEGRITVTLPYNARSSDLSRFRDLRAGDRVSLQAAFLNSTTYQLRQFY